MSKIIAFLSQTGFRIMWRFLVILAILFSGAWLRSEWTRLAKDQHNIKHLEERLVELRESEIQCAEAAKKQIEDWDKERQQTIAEAKANLEKVDEQIRNLGDEWNKKLSNLHDLESQVFSAKYSLDSSLERKIALENKLTFYDHPAVAALMSGPRKRLFDLEKAKGEVLLKEQAYTLAVKSRDTLRAVINNNSAIQELQGRRKMTAGVLEYAKSYQTPDEAAWREERQRKDAEIREIDAKLQSEKAALRQKPMHRMLTVIRPHLATALWILLGVLLVPPVIKAVFYYGLAPLATKLPPVRVLESDNPSTPVAMRKSAVSIPFDIDSESEILVHSDFLQSSSQTAIKRTQWFLNRSLPFSSIASGMFLLTRIRPPEGQSTRVIVSSQNDAFGEINTLCLPEGAAMVVQPRSLAGVIKKAGDPVKIKRCWRITSLHAWLTLQLRFLVFQGPCELILKGCRGVRVEAPDPDQPRMINQASTIGFSANLEYRNSRCETFISYLRGKEDLFNDLFGGGPGVFVYEEMPAGGRKAGLTGRGLEGVADAALKVFGI